MTYKSVYEITKALGTPADNRIIDRFDGGALTNLWTTFTNSGSRGSATINDAINGGLALKTGSTLNDIIGLNFNLIRNYSNTSSSIIITAKVVTASANIDLDTGWGFADTNGFGNLNASGIEVHSGQFTLSATGSARGLTNILALDSNLHVFQITNSVTAVTATIDGANTTSDTGATHLPTGKMNPTIQVQNATATVAEVDFGYLEAFNI